LLCFLPAVLCCCVPLQRTEQAKSETGSTRQVLLPGAVEVEDFAYFQVRVCATVTFISDAGCSVNGAMLFSHNINFINRLGNGRSGTALSDRVPSILVPRPWLNPSHLLFPALNPVACSLLP
jgi:hypothetical protein